MKGDLDIGHRPAQRPRMRGASHGGAAAAGESQGAVSVGDRRRHGAAGIGGIADADVQGVDGGVADSRGQRHWRHHRPVVDGIGDVERAAGGLCARVAGVAVVVVVDQDRDGFAAGGPEVRLVGQRTKSGVELSNGAVHSQPGGGVAIGQGAHGHSAIGRPGQRDRTSVVGNREAGVGVSGCGLKRRHQIAGRRTSQRGADQGDAAGRENVTVTANERARSDALNFSRSGISHCSFRRGDGCGAVGKDRHAANGASRPV